MISPKYLGLIFTHDSLHSGIFVQGVWTQTVTSNLDLTGRKYAINFNLKVDSGQGRLYI